VPIATLPPAEEPVYGGTLKRVRSFDGYNYDQTRSGSSTKLYIVGGHYEQMIRFDSSPTGGASEPLVGDLAESWEISADGLTYTFHLRDDVFWTDGTQFTSADVVHWFRLLTSPPPGLRSSLAGNFMHVQKPLAAPDDFTIVVTLDYPRASTLSSFGDGRTLISAKHIVEPLMYGDDADITALAKNPSLIVGTGPYLFESYTPDVIYRMVRNPNYWKEGLPYLDAIEHFFIRDSNTRFVALATGQIHMTINASRSLTPAQAIQALKYPNTVVPYPSKAPFGVGVRLNANRFPFNDVRLRQALKFSLDVDEYMSVVLSNSVEGAKSTLMPRGTFWALPEDESNAILAPDIAKAQQLVKEAGYENGFDVTFLVRDTIAFIKSAEYLTERWGKNLNWKFPILEVMSSSLQRERTDGGTYDISNTATTGAFLDPDPLINNPFRSGSPGIAFDQAWSPEIDAVLDEQGKTLDPIARRDLVWQAERMIYDLVPRYVFFFRKYTLGISPKLANFVPHDYMYYTQFRMEEVWLRN